VIGWVKRLPDFDGLRFLLCLGIAAFHYSFRIPVKNAPLQDIILQFAYFTDVFFIVSGLFLARRQNYVWHRRQYLGFIGKRLARIYPLHAITFACFALLSVLTAAGILHPSSEPNMSVSDGLTQLLLIHDWGLGKTLSYNYVSWSLSALFLMYLCFPLFDFLCRRLGNSVLVIVILAVTIGEYLAQRLGTPSLTRIQLADVGALRALPSFLFGMWLARRAHPIMPVLAIKLGLAVCVIIFLFYHLPAMVGELSTLEGPLRLAFLYCGVYVLYIASTQDVYTPLQLPVLVRLAPYSFGIFILHPLVGLVFFNALPQHWGETTIGAVLLIAGGVAASVIIAFIAWHIFENPINRWLVIRINRWVNRDTDTEKLLGSG